MNKFERGPLHTFCPHGTFVEPDVCAVCADVKGKWPQPKVTQVDRETGTITLSTVDDE